MKRHIKFMQSCHFVLLGSKLSSSFPMARKILETACGGQQRSQRSVQFPADILRDGLASHPYVSNPTWPSTTWPWGIQWFVSLGSKSKEKNELKKKTFGWGSIPYGLASYPPSLIILTPSIQSVRGGLVTASQPTKLLGNNSGSAWVIPQVKKAFFLRIFGDLGSEVWCKTLWKICASVKLDHETPIFGVKNWKNETT